MRKWHTLFCILLIALSFSGQCFGDGFVPVKSISELSIESFTSHGLNYETELMAIYLGDFNKARLKNNEIAVSRLFRGYLEAYGKYCDAYLPSNKVAITTSECATERVTRNGWGTVTDTSCVRWVDVPTGLYADPLLYNSSNALSRKAGKGMVGKIFSGNPFASRSMLDDVLSIGNDMNNLVRANKCNNAGLKRFENNLYLFVEGKPPLLLPSKETLASINGTDQIIYSSEQIDFRQLLNDLIVENSKGWMMNRYRSGSVSSIKIHTRNGNGSANTVGASYTFDSFGKAYSASVRLTFSNGIPVCLFFSDAPQVCRHPSRKIINTYERGRYLN